MIAGGFMKKGTKVFSKGNWFWGTRPMEVISTGLVYETSVTCSHPEHGPGSFAMKDLIQVSSKRGKARAKKLKQLVKLEEKTEKLRRKLFPKKRIKT